MEKCLCEGCCYRGRMSPEERAAKDAFYKEATTRAEELLDLWLDWHDDPMAYDAYDDLRNMVQAAWEEKVSIEQEIYNWFKEFRDHDFYAWPEIFGPLADVLGETYPVSETGKEPETRTVSSETLKIYREQEKKLHAIESAICHGGDINAVKKILWGSSR